MQIGHSSRSGGSLNRSSSCNSADRFLHAFLCWGRCAIWQSRLQYLTILHAMHAFKSPLLSSSLPQLAHMLLVVDMFVVILCRSWLTTTNYWKSLKKLYILSILAACQYQYSNTKCWCGNWVVLSDCGELKLAGWSRWVDGDNIIFPRVIHNYQPPLSYITRPTPHDHYQSK